MTAREWLDRFAAELGIEAPTDQEVESLLAIAGDAAHGSERIAAPVACWLAARSGRPLAELRAVARGIQPG